VVKRRLQTPFIAAVKRCATQKESAKAVSHRAKSNGNVEFFRKSCPSKPIQIDPLRARVIVDKMFTFERRG
jgi:hypothetical protein